MAEFAYYITHLRPKFGRGPRAGYLNYLKIAEPATEFKSVSAPTQSSRIFGFFRKKLDKMSFIAIEIGIGIEWPSAVVIDFDSDTDSDFLLRRVRWN